MGRYKYSIILFLLLGLISLVSSILHAAGEPYCANYARLAVDQYKASIKAKCNFSGLRWNDDFKGQRQWCLTVTETIAGEETLARAEALIQCKKNMPSADIKELSYEEEEALTQAMIDAAVKDDIAEIEKIIAQGGNIQRELSGNFGTPLYAAIGAQAVKAVKFFIERGVDPNRATNGGVNPLTDLLQNDVVNYDLLEYLLKHGGSVNSQGEAVGDYGVPLFAAINKKDLKAIDILIKNGADVNQTLDYKPALSIVVKRGNLKLAKRLLEAGANPNTGGFIASCADVKSAADYTDFPLNISKDNVEMSKLLKKYGAKALQDCIASKT